MSTGSVSRRALVAGLIASGVAKTAASAVRAGGVIDLMPGFWRVMEATPHGTPAEWARRIAEEYLKPNGAVFEAAGLGKITPARIERWLAQVEPMLPAIRRLDGGIDAIWSANMQVFRRAFPAFDPQISPTYFMPSFFSFDAHLEPHGGVLPLFVGLDGIVRYHGADANLAVLLSHELFHCEHAQRSPSVALEDPERIYKVLWAEGLATCVSERMNPKASRLDVLLDGKRLDAQGDAYVPAWSKALLDCLESTSPDDYGRFFSGGYEGAWPARGGYLVGLLIARRLGRTRSLAELAALPAPQVRTLMAAELARLAKG
ncbi:MAG: hypothetical protein ACREE0_06355 [Phenylobacterium sp.]